MNIQGMLRGIVERELLKLESWSKGNGLSATQLEELGLLARISKNLDEAPEPPSITTKLSVQELEKYVAHDD